MRSALGPLGFAGKDGPWPGQQLALLALPAKCLPLRPAASDQNSRFQEVFISEECDLRRLSDHAINSRTSHSPLRTSSKGL